MTRREAKETIYKVINSGILSDELEQELTEVANHICDNEFEKCNGNDFDSCYCEDCKFLKED